MDLVSLIITLLSGAAGGNLAGTLLKEKNLGIPSNSVIGAVGGGTTNWILHLLGILASAAATTAVTNGADPAAGGIDLGALLGNILGSGTGGAALTALVSFLKDFFQETGSGPTSGAK